MEPPLRESWEVLVDLGQQLNAGLDFIGIVGIQRAAAAAAPALAALATPPPPLAAQTAVIYGPARP
ncbi:MAG TPA: hypothetical protein VIO84_02415 [Candidatus Dormibacteraeota bacterium]